uniref:Uncharacterized protein n=1 Tax=Rhizophora mucronata TaxID=61149 RepID=A0A2P2NN89_RHIMU
MVYKIICVCSATGNFTGSFPGPSARLGCYLWLTK